MLGTPVDLGLSVVIPVHTALGMQNVIEDYVPRPLQSVSTMVTYFACGLAGVGLVTSSLTGQGITSTIKELWRAPPAKQA